MPEPPREGGDNSHDDDGGHDEDRSTAATPDGRNDRLRIGDRCKDSHDSPRTVCERRSPLLVIVIAELPLELAGVRGRTYSVSATTWSSSQNTSESPSIRGELM